METSVAFFLGRSTCVLSAFLIITRYVAYISLLLTCGGHGSTILPGPREITDQLWRISHCDDTRRVSPFRPEGPAPPLRCRRFAYGYALDGSECPKLPGVASERWAIFLLCWIPPQLTRSFWIKISFAPWAMQHFYDLLCTCLSNFVSAGKLWPYLA